MIWMVALLLFGVLLPWPSTLCRSLVPSMRGSGSSSSSSSSSSPFAGASSPVHMGQILHQILQGPLKEDRVTLLLDGFSESSYEDSLLKTVGLPVFLSRVPYAVSGGNTSGGSIPGICVSSGTLSGDVAVSCDTNTVNSTSDEEPHQRALELAQQHPVGEGVLVLVVADVRTSWSLWSPLRRWSLRAVVVVVALGHCDAARTLTAPLLAHTRDVALLCPAPPGTHTSKVPGHRAWTYLPYSSGKQLVDLGMWSPLTFLTRRDLLLDRFSNMGQITINVSSDHADAPMVLLRPDQTVDGASVRLLDALASWLGFSRTFTKTASDEEWGSKENGSWTGMLGEVHRGEKQLAINYFTVTRERALDFDFSVSYFTEGFGISLLVPPPQPRWSSVLRPFTGLVWAATGGLLVLAALILYALAKRRLPALDAFFLVLMGVTNEPVWHVPREWSQRLFLAAWWVASFVLVVSYTGNLIAVLTVPTFPSRIHTIEELAESPYRLCMHDYGEFVPEALATATEKALSALGDKLDLAPLITEMTFAGVEGCIEMVLSGTHALIETHSYMEIVYIKLGHGSRVYSMKDQIYKGSLAFIFQKGTPWKSKFDDGIQRMVDAGLVHKWYSDLMYEFKRGTEEDTSLGRLQSLTLAHLQGPVYLLLAGLAISSVCFVGEHLAYFSTSRRCFWRTSTPWKTDLERT